MKISRRRLLSFLPAAALFAHGSPGFTEALAQDLRNPKEDILLPFIAAAAAGDSPAAEASLPDSGGVERWINRGWKFYRITENTTLDPSAPGFTGADWETVILPHNAKLDAYDQTHPWQGIYWYIKTITPDAWWMNKQVSVKFGAAMQVTDIWVNGVHRVQHLGGYLPFSIDLTDLAAAGQPIVIAARLDNRDTRLVPPGKPTSGLDFTYPGGLYRGVSLIVTEPVHVSDPITANIVAGGGVFVRFANVSSESATIIVKTNVQNDSAVIANNCTVLSQLMDVDGQLVKAALCDPMMISSAGDNEFVQEIIVDNPKLWHPDHPYLYTLITTVSHDGKPTDEVRTRIGIRTIALGVGGFHINGEPYRISGSNRHQEYPYLEYALSPNASRRDAQHIKDGGFNHIRLSHYPQDPAFIDACDELGILVQAPIPGWQQFWNNPSFVSVTFQNIRDLIRRDRNHPSIVFWEPNLNETNPPVDWCEAAYEIAHQEYPGDQCLTFGDAYPTGWHGWDVKNFVREYGDWEFGGAKSTSRQTRGDGEAAMLQQAWNFIYRANDMSKSYEDPKSLFEGYATWCMYDYNRGYDPVQEHSGMMDIFRLPKYVYFFYQSQRDPSLIRYDCKSGPMAFIANNWEKRESPARVVIFSNCEEIELSINGKIIDRQKPDSGPDSPYSKRAANLTATVGSDTDDSGGYMFNGGNGLHLVQPMFTFQNVPYAPGALKAVGYIDGQPQTEMVMRTPLAPKSLQVEFDTARNPMVADGADAVFVRANILDKNGTIVPLNSFPSLQLTVEGPARLVGLDPLHVEAGVASALLQSTGGMGEIRVTAKAHGLATASAMITPQKPNEIISRTPGVLFRTPDEMG